jgi:hypothetical protein
MACVGLTCAEADMELGTGGDKLLSQRCWELGFPTNDGVLAPYLAGTSREVNNVLPERDLHVPLPWS